jgi:hypothetical protein
LGISGTGGSGGGVASVDVLPGNASKLRVLIPQVGSATAAEVVVGPIALVHLVPERGAEFKVWLGVLDCVEEIVARVKFNARKVWGRTLLWTSK